jgi:hypothetical protein
VELGEPGWGRGATHGRRFVASRVLAQARRHVRGAELALVLHRLRKRYGASQITKHRPFRKQFHVRGGSPFHAARPILDGDPMRMTYGDEKVANRDTN